MRIVYLVHFNLRRGSGVYKKIRDQVSWWVASGHDVRLCVVTRQEETRKEFLESDLGAIVSVEMYKAGLSPSSLAERLDAFRRARDTILGWNPDVVYTRLDLYYPPVADIGRNKPLVIEVNGFHSVELLRYSRFQWAYSRLTMGRLLNAAAGLVFVTRELSEMDVYSRFRKPYRVIGNGICLREFEPVPPVLQGEVHLVFIGHNGIPWHGVDKIMYLARACPDWRFDIVGTEALDDARELPNVHFHGFLDRGRYVRLLERAECAIGTLALHRAGINEASPLKTREYLAYGIPVVTGYLDTDFPEETEFMLRLPNEEDNVKDNVPAIRHFVAKWRGKRVPRSDVLRIDSRQKEAERLSFFASLLDTKGR